MTDNLLKRTRKALGMTQTKMGAFMGLSLRGYQDLEYGSNEARPMHYKALAFAVIAKQFGLSDEEVLQNLSPVALAHLLLAKAERVQG